MYKKILLSIAILCLLMGSVSAFEFDNKAEAPENFKVYEDTVTIKNTFALLFPLGKVADIKLLENTDQALINGRSKFQVILYEDYTNPLKDIYFEDKGRNKINKDSYSGDWYYYDNSPYSFEVDNYKEVCDEDTTLKNGSIEKNCYKVKDGTRLETGNYDRWLKYEGGEFKAGTYIFEYRGQKPINLDVDFKPVLFGVDLGKYYVWWDSDWNKKRQIDLTENNGTTLNNYSIFLNVTYDSDMNNNFSDLRFTNGSENTELNYYVEQIVEGEYADVWVFVGTLNPSVNTSIYMYYDNDEAVTASSFKDSFIFADDFSTNTTANYQTNAYATLAITEESLRLTTDDNQHLGIVSPKMAYQKLNQSYVIEINVSKTNGFYSGVCVGQQNLGGETTMFYNWISNEVVDSIKIYRGWTGQIEIATTPYTYAGGVYQKFKNTYLGSNITATAINSTGSYSASGIDTTFSEGYYELMTYTGAGAVTTIYDWVRVYPTVAIEPDYNILEEESGEPAAPTITLNQPVEFYNSTSNDITFNCSADDPGGLGVINLSLYVNGILNYTVYNSTENQNLTLQITNTYADGNDYFWNCSAFNGNLKQGNGTNRNFSIDSTSPAIAITDPGNKITYASEGDNQNLNWTINDTNLDSCWYEYGGSNTTVTCGDNTTIFVLTTQQNITLYSNDTFGNLNSLLRSWNYSIFSRSQDYNLTGNETARESFLINVTTDESILSVDANLWYNGSYYVGSSSCSGTLCEISRSIDLPLVESPTDQTENKSYFWELTIYNGTSSTTQNTSLRNQNVSKIFISRCDSTYTIQTLNFTAYDEQNLSQLDFDFLANFDYWIGEGTVKKNYSFENTNQNNASICMLQNYSLKTDATIEYRDGEINETYGRRNYYFDNEPLNNTQKDIRLYLLLSTEATSFILNVRDNDLISTPQALVYTNRYYPETNTYRVVQIGRTDDNGKTVGFFETEDVLYNFKITKNQIILLQTNNQKVVPESAPYTLTFTTGAGAGDIWEDITPTENLDVNLSFNKDKEIVTYKYIDSSGGVTQGRLLVVLTNYSGSDVIICNLTSSLRSGTLSCNVSGYNGTFTATGFISKSPEIVEKIITFSIAVAKDIFGNTGLLMGWFIILVAAMTAIFNKIAGIWTTILAVVMVNMIGLITFSSLFVFSLIGLGVLLTVVLKN